MRSSKFLLTVALVLGIALAAGSFAAADPGQRPCTLGDAKANFEAPYPNHLLDSFGICQYRLFFDGETFTFCQDDVILGGVTYSAEYKDLGWSREEAIAWLELTEAHVWLDGVEVPLMRTVYKNGLHPRTGQMVVFQHRAFMTQLPVGQHTSYYEDFHPDFGLFTATVNLLVLPRTDPACS